MSDKELLELAAKAAAIRGHWIERTPEDGYPGYTCGIGPALVLWNPLTNDGDALRLAVKARIQIDPLLYETFVGWGFRPHEHQRANELRESHMDDEMAATRRAIVRAAAEIGKAML